MSKNATTISIMKSAVKDAVFASWLSALTKGVFNGAEFVASTESGSATIKLLAANGKSFANRVVAIPADILEASVYRLFEERTGINGYNGRIHSAILAACCFYSSNDLRTLIGRVEANVEVGISINQEQPVQEGFSSLANTRCECGPLKTYIRSFKDSIFAVKTEQGIIAQGDSAKMVARVGTLISSTPVLDIKGVKVACILSQGDISNDLWAAIQAGACIISNDLLIKYGSFRAVSETIGLKFEAVPDMLGITTSLGIDIVAGPNSIKAGVAGIVKSLRPELSFEDVLTMSKEESEAILAEATTSAEIAGSVASIIVVNEDLKITNLHSAEGLLRTDDEDESSVYNGIVTLMKEGEISSIPQYVMEEKLQGNLLVKKDKVGLTVGTLQNARISHGKAVADDLIKLANTSQWKQFFSAGEYKQYSAAESARIIAGISGWFTGSIPMGLITRADIVGGQIEEFSNVILNGGKIADIDFPGLSKETVVLTMGGRGFVFPKSMFGKNAAMEIADDNGEILSIRLSAGLQLLMGLIIASRNKNNRWELSAITHNAEVNKAVFGNADSFDVDGRYQTLVPLYWLKDMPANYFWSVYACRKNSKNWALMKQPVIFDQAILGAKLVPGGMARIFGTNSAVFAEAISKMVFCHPDLIIGQRNDCDGDLMAVVATKGVEVPQYEGQRFNKAWFDNYRADELSSSIKYKAPVVMSKEDIAEGYAIAAAAKDNIGIYCANLFRAQHVIDVIMSNNDDEKLHNDLRVIKECMAAHMQDGAVSAIKHSADGKVAVEFAEIDIISNDDADSLFLSFSALVDFYGENVSSSSLELFVRACVRASVGSNQALWRAANLVTSRSNAGLEAINGKRTGNKMSLFALFTGAYWNKMAAKSRQPERHKFTGSAVSQFRMIGRGMKALEDFGVDVNKADSIVGSILLKEYTRIQEEAAVKESAEKNKDAIWADFAAANAVNSAPQTTSSFSSFQWGDAAKSVAAVAVVEEEDEEDEIEEDKTEVEITLTKVRGEEKYSAKVEVLDADFNVVKEISIVVDASTRVDAYTAVLAAIENAGYVLSECILVAIHNEEVSIAATKDLCVALEAYQA